MMYDVCFVVDGTGSMGAYLNSLRESLPQVVHLIRVLSTVDRVGVLVYRDYGSKPDRFIEFSGWHHKMDEPAAFISRLRPEGGGGPEAAKTGALRLLAECDKPCVVFWYADAPPHHRQVSIGHYDVQHLQLESKALGADFDWVAICRKFATAQHRVFAFLDNNNCQYNDWTFDELGSFFGLLAGATGGCATRLLHPKLPDEIAKHTIGMLLALAGHEYDFAGRVERLALQPVDEALVHTEVDCDRLLPCAEYGIRPLESAPMTVSGLGAAGMLRDGTSVGLAERFAADGAFQDVVYAVLSDVLQPELVKALTYNNVFGTLWRAVCKSRGDARRDALVARMGETISVLPEVLKDELKAFIELSYDQSDAVEEMAAAAAAAAPGGPVIVLDMPQVREIARNELLEISRSCHHTVLSKVGGLLTGLRIVDVAAEADAPLKASSLPLALSAADLFAALPHLMCPGTLFSKRPAAILAVVAVYTGSILREQAAESLHAIRGTWIDLEQPENWAMDFVGLVLRVPSCLTETELARFQGLWPIAGLLINRLTDVEVDTGFSSCKAVRPDRKVTCAKCGEVRSFTLITPSGECGLCKCVAPAGQASLGDTFKGTLPSDRSCWCECRICHVHYAVENAAALNVPPKCHFCRYSKQAAPSVECSKCANAFLCQTGQPSAPFVCPPCSEADNSPPPQRTVACVQEYLAQNGAGFLGMDIPDIGAFFKCRSLLTAAKAAVVRDVGAASDPAASGPAASGSRPMFNGKPVLNHEAILETIQMWMGRGEAQSGCCMLCFEDMPKAALLSVCGRRRCETHACRACLDAWYGAPKPGELCSQTQLQCPFCKQLPAAKTLARHNKELMALHVEGLGALDPAWHHGWCTQCYHVRPAVSKTCAEAAPALSDFVCDACESKRCLSSAVSVTVQDCPGCHASVEKTSGCNHIECMCGTHWCWACRHVDNASEIYTHMYAKHGGYYNGGIGQDVGDAEDA